GRQQTRTRVDELAAVIQLEILWLLRGLLKLLRRQERRIHDGRRRPKDQRAFVETAFPFLPKCARLRSWQRRDEYLRVRNRRNRWPQRVQNVRQVRRRRVI